MMERPLIGISWETCDSSDKLYRNRFGNYERAVLAAGGAVRSIGYDDDPVQLARELDGWLITGGKDIDPAHFGQERANNGEQFVNENRYAIERRLFQTVTDDLPILGICYGCQFINVQLGGNIIQHLSDEKLAVHRDGNRDAIHDHFCDAGSEIANILRSNNVKAVSHHHQAIEDLGQDLRVTARHPESSIIECIESKNRPWLIGVQWHPERSLELDSDNQKIFESLVSAAAKYRADRRVASL